MNALPFLQQSLPSRQDWEYVLVMNSFILLQHADFLALTSPFEKMIYQTLSSTFLYNKKWL